MFNLGPTIIVSLIFIVTKKKKKKFFNGIVTKFVKGPMEKGHLLVVLILLIEPIGDYNLKIKKRTKKKA